MPVCSQALLFSVMENHPSLFLRLLKDFSLFGGNVETEEEWSLFRDYFHKHVDCADKSPEVDRQEGVKLLVVRSYVIFEDELCMRLYMIFRNT